MKRWLVRLAGPTGRRWLLTADEGGKPLLNGDELKDRLAMRAVELGDEDDLVGALLAHGQEVDAMADGEIARRRAQDTTQRSAA